MERTTERLFEAVGRIEPNQRPSIHLLPGFTRSVAVIQPRALPLLGFAVWAQQTSGKLVILTPSGSPAVFIAACTCVRCISKLSQDTYTGRSQEEALTASVRELHDARGIRVICFSETCLPNPPILEDAAIRTIGLNSLSRHFELLGGSATVKAALHPWLSIPSILIGLIPLPKAPAKKSPEDSRRKRIERVLASM